MTALGTNLKWTLGHTHRDAMRTMFEVFGVKHVSPMDDFDLFTLGDGANIGVYYVQDDQALDSAQMERGAWIELVVDDELAVMNALAEQDITPFEYFDKDHRYFRAPGGQVFRLASRA